MFELFICFFVLDALFGGVSENKEHSIKEAWEYWKKENERIEKYYSKRAADLEEYYFWRDLILDKFYEISLKGEPWNVQNNKQPPDSVYRVYGLCPDSPCRDLTIYHHAR